MAVYNIGILIKNLRLQHGLTQAELAEGICSRDTVVKIENGKRKADHYILKNILSRLDADDLLEYSSAVPDTKTFELFEQTSKLYNRGKFDEMEKLLNQIETDQQTDLNLNERQILTSKIAYRMRPDLTTEQYQEGIDMSFELLKINRPNFHMDDLETYYLSPGEFERLSHLGTIYGLNGEYDKSATLFQELINNYDKKYGNKVRPKPWYISLFNNCAFALSYAERYEEALEVVEKGLNLLLYSSAMQYYSMLHIKATCLCRLKRMEEGKETYKKLCYLLIATGGDAVANFETVTEEFEKEFGLVFEEAVIRIKNENPD